MTNLLPQKPKQKKELTPKQEAFIDALIENGGNVSQAMKLAGYEPTSRTWLVNSVSSEIVERTQNYLAAHGMKAANNLITALDEDGTTPKGELRLKAAESLLNRIGIGSRETIDHNVTAIHGVVLLPNKQDEKIIDG
jgi:hypothetical protein|tara:strand:- start:1256 stop:1666 length:411 start_codon:yes stop_codon:yes gene_type:complete